MTACITTAYKVESVLLALGISTICCFAVSIFACYTKYDFTSWAGVMFVMMVGMILFGFVLIFVKAPFAEKVYAGIGSILFMAFLALDTRMIMGGKNMEISPDEHIYATIHLYMDILQIFMFILQLFGDKDFGRRPS